MTPRALVVDFGGVLTPSVRESYTAFCESEGIDPQRFRAVIREAYRGGGDDHALVAVELGLITREQFEERLAALLSDGLAQPIDPSGLTLRIFGAPYPVPEMLEVVGRVRETGAATAMLSNSLGDIEYPPEVVSLFDEVVLSGRVGLRKPDPRIFEHTLELLGVRAAETVFVDDARPNVEAARGLGMEAILHDRPGETVASLRKLFRLD
ncbi:MAG TPA: HAD family phosphatase [Actinomycetota bacterium]|nr:HAD family phosphatase [Actinomycetota bacterium]